MKQKIVVLLSIHRGHRNKLDVRKYVFSNRLIVGTLRVKTVLPALCKMTIKLALQFN